jgi:hypothetical protein
MQKSTSRMTDHNAIYYGFFGTSAPTAAFLISFTELEMWLRILSLIIGIATGIVMFYNLVKKK